MRKFTYIDCPVCGKEFQSLGYASHRAMHRRQREKAAKKLQQPPVIKSVCVAPKERDNLDLLTLTFELHGRAISQPNNKLMHEAYVEARQELESRLKVKTCNNVSYMKSSGLRSAKLSNYDEL